jgi:hypothetical protein
MSRINSVFKLLVSKDNKNLLAAGSDISALTVGQVGVFDATTNKALGAVSLQGKDFFFATAIDEDGDGVIDNILITPTIKSENRVYTNKKAYVAPVNQKVKIKNYKAEAGTEYGIKIAFNNAEEFKIYGFNNMSKLMMVKTQSISNALNSEIDSNYLTLLLKNAIKDNCGDNVKVKTVWRTTGITSVPDPDVDNDILNVLIPANVTATPANKKYTDLEIEILPSKLGKKPSAKADYNYPRETVATVSLVGALGNNGVVEILNKPTYEQNSGYDVRKLEYFAKGLIESPYRESAIFNVDDTQFVSDVNGKYVLYVFAFDNKVRGGLVDYTHNQSVIIAAPTADTNTITDLDAIIV